MKGFSIAGCLIAVLIVGCTTLGPTGNTRDAGVVARYDSGGHSEFVVHEVRMRSLAEEYYPEIVRALWDDPTEAPVRFSVVVKDELIEGELGLAGSSRVLLNGPGLLAQSNKLEHVFLHEMAHVAQDIPRFRFFWSVPRHWLEGLADFAVYQLDRESKLQAPCCSAEYPDLESGYSCAAAFLLFLEQRYGENLARELNRRVCRGGYSDEFFREFTGRDLSALWAEFKQTPAYTPSAREMGMIKEAMGTAWDLDSENSPQQVLDFIQMQSGGSLTLEARAWLHLSNALESAPPELRGATGYLTYGLLDGLPSPTFPFTQTFHFSPANLFPNVYQFVVTKNSEASEWELSSIRRTGADGRTEDLPMNVARRHDGPPDPVRVFIFAGQSNMEGADSRIEDVKNFPPFSGLDQPLPDVRFSYSLGRENKKESNGWVALQSVNGWVGPELSFARDVTAAISMPMAIIKVAAGGTHLGGDWNPDEPQGFEMYPLLLKTVRSSLKQLEDEGVDYRLEGFMWHQGENDMFNEDYLANYGDNLENFIRRCREDLGAPDLKFYVGELCTKTIWGMDLRPRMYAISRGQKQAVANVPNVEYVPTSHVGVEIGNPVGLHYHYGTLGQLQHGVNYADAYLRPLKLEQKVDRSLRDWPHQHDQRIRLFVLAGHRNMEGERAFVQELAGTDRHAGLLKDDASIPFRYHIGGGYRSSDGWEPLGPAGFCDTFGPELSFGHALKEQGLGNIAIAKFTHSGSQIIDWTPEGSMAESRNLYPAFIAFIRESIRDLEMKGHEVELAGVFYHLGENDMSFGPFRQAAAQWLKSFVEQSRVDLGLPGLNWFVSQQPPTDHESVNQIDVVAEVETVAAEDLNLIHIKAFDLPEQEQQLVLDTAGVVALGELLAARYAEHR